mmetsp:Transcript_44891/g.143805  ORF Transcript_44891/g.143805 Transcript_44891/m.143805 type:complete len:256 (+) Transcript_44891:517-1284(+)
MADLPRHEVAHGALRLLQLQPLILPLLLRLLHGRHLPLGRLSLHRHRRCRRHQRQELLRHRPKRSLSSWSLPPPGSGASRRRRSCCPSPCTDPRRKCPASRARPPAPSSCASDYPAEPASAGSGAGGRSRRSRGRRRSEPHPLNSRTSRYCCTWTCRSCCRRRCARSLAASCLRGGLLAQVPRPPPQNCCPAGCPAAPAEGAPEPPRKRRPSGCPVCAPMWSPSAGGGRPGSASTAAPWSDPPAGPSGSPRSPSA